MNKSYRHFINIIAISLLLIACGKADKTNDVKTNETTIVVSSISGQVSADFNLSDVKVSVADQTTKSDVNGFYLFKNLSTNEKRLVLTFEKSGFGVYQRSILVEENQQYAVDARLLRYQYEETVDLLEGATLVVKDPDDVNKPVLVKLDLPKGSVLGDTNVSVSIARGDPTTAAGRAVFPGDFMAAESADAAADTPLESIAFTEITLTTSDGKEITQLEKPATLTVRLPDVFQENGDRAGTYIPGDPEKGTIEWWSYDENRAVWIREDAKPATDEIDDATVIMETGMLYAQAEVTHFSWWNADRPVTEHACLCVRVVDENGDPVVGAQIVADGVTYDGRSTPALTDSNGRACVTVKRSIGIGTRERVKISVQFGGISFFYNVTSNTEGFVNTDQIYTPTQAGSTIRTNTGKCIDLNNVILMAFNGTINGTVRQEGSNAVVAGFTLYSNFGREVVTDSSGKYSIKVPMNQPVTLFAPEISSKTVTVTNSNSPLTVNFLIPNIPPSIESITRSLEGVIENSATVLLTAIVTDKENDAISYNWQLSSGTGTLSNSQTNVLSWTAPTSGAGTDTLRLIVTDARGAISETELSIVWGQSIVGGTIFNLSIRDSETELPMSGVTVVLYNSDNKTFSDANVKVTDDAGVVDFGDVGSTRITFSIFSEQKVSADYLESEQNNRRINTFMNVPTVEAGVYYLENQGDNFSKNCNLINVAKIVLENVPLDSDIDVSPGIISDFNGGPEPAISMCDYAYNQAIAKDGKVSFLVTASKFVAFDSPLDLLAYGMLIDVVQDTAVRTIKLNKTPGSVLWTNQSADQFTKLRITGVRRNIEYEWPGSFRPQFGETSIDGLIDIPRAFPFDGFDVAARNLQELEDSGIGTLLNLYTVNKRYTDLPESIELNSPTVKFNTLDYSSLTNNVTWGTSETFTDDYQRLLFLRSTMSTETLWTINLAATESNWDVMNLPPIAAGWVDISDLTVSFDDVSVSKADFVSLQGFDQIWASLITSESDKSFFSNSVTIIGAKRFNIANDGIMRKSGNSRINNSQYPNDSSRLKAQLSTGLQGFLRIRY